MKTPFAILICILLTGAWLRFDALTQDVRFHPDEALFATFARNAAVYGDWLLPGALDKTPLSLYASALAMQFAGVKVNDKGVLDLDLLQGEFAARLPNTLTGISLIALVYALTKKLSEDEWSALIAAALVAFSPQLIAFSATAFTDGLMLVSMVGALVMAARGRPAWSGFWLAISVWSKQQGVFYLPLVLWLLINELNHTDSPHPLSPSPLWRRGKKRDKVPLHQGEGLMMRAKDVISQLLRFIVAFAAGIMLLLLWDAARGTTSIFALAAVNNNPERTFVRLDEIMPRLLTWVSYAATWFGAWWLTAGIVIIGFLARNSRLMPLKIYVTGYLLLHVVLAFNTYDRYLLPIMPLVAVLAGTAFGELLNHKDTKITKGTARRTPTNMRFFQNLYLNWRFSSLSPRPSALIILSLVMLLTGYPAGFPTDVRARDAEIIRLADHVNAKPLGAILYDHWLGWEIGYYIGAWSDKRRVYYPDAEIQAQDALLNPDPAPRYLIVPVEVDSQPWLTAFEKAGFSISVDYISSRYQVYRLLPPF